jgi:hypothetical protein
MTNTFLTLDGKVFRTERFRQGPKLSDGCHWHNAYDKTYVETTGEIESVDVNERTLFGYPEDEFMRRQYK